MQRLPISDAGWLLIEDRALPMHVGGLQLFRPPEDAGPDYRQQLVEMVREQADVRPPFNQRLARPYGLAPGIYHWVEDPSVELDYHLRHLALPEPGRIRELLALVSTLHANLLDRHRPLWEAYVIEGLEDGRFAAYTKIHHSMLDGVAAMRQLVKSFSPDPAVRDLPAPWAIREEHESGDASDGPPRNPFSLVGRIVAAATEGVSSTFGVTRAIATQLVRAQRDAAEVMPFDAPPSMLNVPLTGARRYVAQSYDFDRIRDVGTALDATVNDVVLTMCSSALRAYLEDQDALPDRPLIALVPVSYRDKIGGDAGNAVSLVPANLATHLADPLDRLELIRASMNRAKQRVRGMSAPELVSYALAMIGPLMLGQLAGVAGRMRPIYNLVISNVPGPQQPLYWNGARMEGLYPLSLLPDGQAINITQTSYAGSMEFGITADRNALPSIQRMIDHLEDALTELEKAAAA